MASATNKPPPGSETTNLEAFFANGIDLQTADGATIQKYVTYIVQQYADHNVKDYSLWEAIQFDFGDFKEKHFNKLSNPTWNLLRDYCYTLDQIKWVEDRYNTLSRCTLKRKQELIGVTNPPLQQPGFGQQGFGQYGLRQPGFRQIGLGFSTAADSQASSADPQTQISQDISYQHGHQFSPFPLQKCNNSAETKADSAMIPPHQFPKPQERARQEREQCEHDNQRREQQRLE
ncbi:hypothetical protein MMC22_003064 [Lobaria immixta]|nr:hypothetical protein [Lobaria immixta]